MIRAGISTACYYPELTERALQAAANTGAPCVEVFVNAAQECTPAFFDALRRGTDARGVDIVSIHPFTSGFEPATFFSDYIRRLEDGLDFYRRLFDLTARIGARFFILHGAYTHCRIGHEEVFERVGRLADAARSCGVTLLQENVARCLSGDPDFIRSMRRALGDRIQFVLDTKQAVRRDVDPFDMLDAMSGALRHVHISDYRPGNDCVPPAPGGLLDLPRLIGKLRGLHFSGDMILELYRESYNEESELKESILYLSSFLLI